MAETCEVGLTLIADAPVSPCPALVWRDGRFWCGMVETPSRFVDRQFIEGLSDAKLEWFDRMIGAQVAMTLGGVGGPCDSGSESDRRDPDEGLTVAEWLATGANQGSEDRDRQSGD